MLISKPVQTTLTPNHPKLLKSPKTSHSTPALPAAMISDNDLYSLAVFLGSLSVLLIVLYHFLEVNAKEDDTATRTTKAENRSKGATPVVQERGKGSVKS
ncbi:MAG: hypothetical protein Q9201_001663 [Fulgogasparrea decipioides]